MDIKKRMIESKIILTILYGDLYNTVIDKINSSGEKTKEYLANEENVKDIALVVYDIMPLIFKLSIRYEKFYEDFKIVFLAIRNNVFHYEKHRRTFPHGVLTSSLEKEVNITINNDEKIIISKSKRSVNKKKEG